MNLASNETAKKYDVLQKSIDWNKASNDKQLEIMDRMLSLLGQAPPYTAIFDFGCTDMTTGNQSIRTSIEMYARIEKHINRLK